MNVETFSFGVLYVYVDICVNGEMTVHTSFYISQCRSRKKNIFLEYFSF